MYKGPNVVIDCDIKPNASYKQLLHFIDTLFSSCIIAPLVIANWRGTWNLCDIYLMPDDPIRSAFASVVIGFIGYMIFMLPQKLFCDKFDREKNRLTFYIFSRLYTFLFGIISVHGCRGPWNLADLLTPINLTVVNLLTICAVFLLIITRSLANINAPPFLISTDEREDFFAINTRFKTSATQEPVLYIFDCIFSTLVIGVLVAIVWRGVWVFSDIVLYPEDANYSAWGSLILGYGITAITFAIQPVIRIFCDQIEGGYWRIAVADAFMFLSFIGTMNVWRGIWWLLDIYFLPEDEILSNSVCVGLSYALLVLLNCSNSILVRGVFIDAEEPSGRCVVFPIYYIRAVFERQRNKKHRYLLDLLKDQNQNHNILLVLGKNQENSKVNIIRIDTAILNDDEKSENSNIKDFTAINCMEEDAILLDETKIAF